METTMFDDGKMIQE